MILLKITERMISLRPSKQIYPIERIISAASYLTAGGAGFIWLLIAAIMQKHVTPFLLYHIMQSIFLSILYFIIATLAELVYAILYRIPLINAIPYFANMPLPFLFGLSAIQGLTTALILYLAITSFMGLYSYIPWVSDIININTGRK